MISQVGIFVSKERDLKKKQQSGTAGPSSSTFKLYLNIHQNSVVAVFSNYRLIFDDKRNNRPIMIENIVEDNTIIDIDNDVDYYDYYDSGIDKKKINDNNLNDDCDVIKANDKCYHEKNISNNNNIDEESILRDDDIYNHNRNRYDDFQINESMNKNQINNISNIQNKVSVDYTSCNNIYDIYDSKNSDEKNTNDSNRNNLISIADNYNDTNYDRKNNSTTASVYNIVTVQNSRANSMNNLCESQTKSRDSHTKSGNLPTFINSQLSTSNLITSDYKQNTFYDSKSILQKDSNTNYGIIGIKSSHVISKDMNSNSNVINVMNSNSNNNDYKNDYNNNDNNDNNNVTNIQLKVRTLHNVTSTVQVENKVPSVFAGSRSEPRHYSYDNDGNSKSKKVNNKESRNKVSFNDDNRNKNNDYNDDNGSNQNWKGISNTYVNEYNDFDDYRDTTSHIFEKNDGKNNDISNNSNNDIDNNNSNNHNDNNNDNRYNDNNRDDIRNRNKGEFFDKSNVNKYADINDSYDVNDNNDDDYNHFVNRTNKISSRTSHGRMNNDTDINNDEIYDNDHLSCFYQDRITNNNTNRIFLKDRVIQNSACPEIRNLPLSQNDQILRNNMNINCRESVTSGIVPTLASTVTARGVRKRSVD